MSTDPDKSKRKLWNAMVYLAGENNLAEECVFALKEMKRARPRPSCNNCPPTEADIDGRRDIDRQVDKQVKIVAQLDAGGLGGNEVRYILKRGDIDGLLQDSAITTRDTTETSYRGVLKDFISSSIILEGQADHYLLVLSGHGNGLLSDFLSRDNETFDKLSIPKIQWVLREVKQDLTESISKEVGDAFMIDILGLDSCLMSMAEIGYELRKYVRYTVGAEGFEPNSGWPYERILSDLLTKPTMDAQELVFRIVERYVTYYKDFLPAGRSVDQSACDLSKCEALKNAILELANVLTAKIGEAETKRQVVLAHWEAQSYKDDQYVDLYDFCDLLDRGPDDQNPATGSVVMKGLKVNDYIRTACQNVKRVLNPFGKDGGDPPMVMQSCYSGPAVQYSHGLSLYFPWSNVIESYKDLEFANDTNWRHFLLKYIDVTRRGKRLCPYVTEKVETEKGATDKVVTGQLFFNPTVAGFDFLLGTNKDAPTFSRVLSNKVGSMKNPALDHVPCQCPKKYPDDPTPDNRRPMATGLIE